MHERNYEYLYMLLEEWFQANGNRVNFDMGAAVELFSEEVLTDFYNKILEPNGWTA